MKQHHHSSRKDPEIAVGTFDVIAIIALSLPITAIHRLIINTIHAAIAFVLLRSTRWTRPEVTVNLDLRVGRL
jgi:hypothetical protein